MQRVAKLHTPLVNFACDVEDSIELADSYDIVGRNSCVGKCVVEYAVAEKHEVDH